MLLSLYIQVNPKMSRFTDSELCRKLWAFLHLRLRSWCLERWLVLCFFITFDLRLMIFWSKQELNIEAILLWSICSFACDFFEPSTETPLKDSNQEDRSFSDSSLFSHWGQDLNSESRRVALKMFQYYGYNGYLSDRLPMDRAIPDYRPEGWDKLKKTSSNKCLTATSWLETDTDTIKPKVCAPFTIISLSKDRSKEGLYAVVLRVTVTVNMKWVSTRTCLRGR